MRLPFLLLLILSLNSFVYSQAIEGKITDVYGNPISAVNIVNLTNKQHAHSDDSGAFRVGVTKVGDTLSITHVAYLPQRYVVQSTDTKVQIVMEKQPISLDEVVITNELNTLKIISDIDIQKNPVNSSQEVLRKVPGLFIGQHAGGGKAEQIFLRGFDVDHGTDVHLSVDGMPVNMVSHAHGQGYADLHFLIPEIIEKVDFGKGPYHQNKGNFTTAGFVGFQTKDRIKTSSLQMEAGMFDTKRMLGIFNLLNKDNHHAYIASEYVATDGPFVSPQHFNRINLFGKYSGRLNQTLRIGLSASYFSSSWDASGQIPVRAVESGRIGRFGAIDDTEGGNTSRRNFILNLDKIIDENTFIKNTIYLSRYDFELFSNFTFFLEDSVNGDQIVQRENRNLFGFNSEYRKNFKSGKWKGAIFAGLSLRNDRSEDNELSHTKNRRETLEQLRLGNIHETNIGAYAGAMFEINKWSFHPSVRLDYFDFNYTDALQTTYEVQTNATETISPKLNIAYNASKKFQLYLKGGKGFHSNDTRAVVEQEGINILPAAYGADLGYVWKPASNMLLNMAVWYLYLEQEFVYVGDAGIVEASGRTRRQGVEISYRYQPVPSFYWSVDANYTYARAMDEEVGENYIPLAPDLTLMSGLQYRTESGLYSGLNLRYMKDRPANEDNSIVAAGYTVVDLNAGYEWKRLMLGVQIQNLLDTEWNEAQFATESRLADEPQPVEEIHFTPGTPFFAKAMLRFKF